MPQTDDKPEVLIKGIAAAPGVAHGPAFVFFRDIPHVPNYPIPPEGLAAEEARFQQALVAAHSELRNLRKSVAARLGESEAAIFDALLLVMEDPALVEGTLDLLRETKRNAEHCFAEVAGNYVRFFSQNQDEYLTGRTSDLRDVTRRIMSHLTGVSQHTLANVSDKRVIVADDLTPSDTASLDAGHALAIVTDGGNRTSHAVIMSRSLRIPAVVGVLVATEKIAYNDEVLVDGYEGKVFLNPTRDTLYAYGRLEKAQLKLHDSIRAEVALPDETADGIPFKLSANVNSVEDVESGNKNFAHGVGLFRTESLFMRDPERIPDEEMQYTHYRNIIEAAAPARVIVRTLDVGGDKPHGALLRNFRSEKNPFMGFRAIRYCLENRAVFRTQLRAILRASAHGKARVMFPMISSLDELLAAKAFLREVAAELKHEGVPFDEAISIGTMIEIPSAAVSAGLLVEHCDFLSIGTNDLVQYMLAVDRDNGRIAHLYEPCNPAVLIVLRDIIRAARERKKPVSVCGELAGDKFFAPLLIALGANTLSMTPIAIPEIRYILRRCTTAALQELVNRVYAEYEPEKTKAILHAFTQERLKPE